jgi:branched-chain amino acid transport system permease protein
LLTGAWRVDIGTGFVQLTYTKIFILVAALPAWPADLHHQVHQARPHVPRHPARPQDGLDPGINTDRVISYVFIIGAAMAAWPAC